MQMQKKVTWNTVQSVITYKIFTLHITAFYMQ